MATDRFAPTADLPRLTKEVMVLTTLVQGAGVYALLEGWFGPAGPLRLIALSLLLAVPGFFVLCVRQLGDRLLWRGMAALALLLVALHGSVWWLLGSQDARSGSAWVPWLLSQGALLFIALAWMQALQQQRSLRRVPYALLFDHAWNNAVVLGFALQFVALGWAVLGLWAGLFALVKVRLFADTFTAPAFVYMATGLMAGLGVLLARGQPRPLRLMLQLVLTLYRLLLPLLALVVVLFVAFLPFTGVQPLWETRKAAPLLMGVLLCLLVFVNAVYQDGSRQAAPYPSALRALIAAALALMPVLAALALWAVALRVRQYGWTHERIWAVAIAGVLMLYALGYAWAALERDAAAWLQRIGCINPAMSWLVMALLVLLHTPLFDPYRIGAASQYQRLADGTQAPTLQALQDLRFDHGRHGLPALERLQALPAFAQGQVAQDVHQMLGAEAKRYLSRQAAVLTAEDWRSRLAVAPGHTPPPEDWWQALADKEITSGSFCQGAAQKSAQAGDVPQSPDAQTAPCLILQASLDSASGQPQQLLCTTARYNLMCRVFARDTQREQAHWQQVGEVRWPQATEQQQAQLVQALREGRVQVQASPWRDLAVPGLPTGRVQ